jgi:uncharacterized phage protein (TIGR02218 family)
MRQVPTELGQHLLQDATTTCYCWRVLLSDGALMGFTDHDEALQFDGLSYLAASGFHASDSESANGFAASSSEIAGGFSSEAVREDDLSNGRYDGARVELFLVNWRDVSQRLLLEVREVGEVSRAGGHFQAELRSLAHRLAQPQGRIYSRRCDARFGDNRCRMNLSAYQATGAISVLLSAGRFEVSGLDAQASGRFRLGRLTFTSGDNAGSSFEIEDHSSASGVVALLFWIPPERLVAVGDTFTVTAGCDKSFAMCAGHYGNQLNFQGFPHMPGGDFAYSYVNGMSVHDGGALF